MNTKIWRAKYRTTGKRCFAVVRHGKHETDYVIVSKHKSYRLAVDRLNLEVHHA